MNEAQRILQQKIRKMSVPQLKLTKNRVKAAMTCPGMVDDLIAGVAQMSGRTVTKENAKGHVELIYNALHAELMRRGA
jgi:hypothetical protein